MVAHITMGMSYVCIMKVFRCLGILYAGIDILIIYYYST